MSGWYRRWFAAFVLILSGAIAAPTAFAETTYSFNLPEQSLADSLRAIGQQTEMNILFEPDAVKNARSPALRGQYTVDEAIRIVLAGTKLEAQHTAASNVVIKVKSTRSTVLPATSVDVPGSSGTRLAQSNSGSPQSQSQSATSPQNVDTLNSTSESSKKEGLSEIVVTGTHIRGSTQASPIIEISRKDIDRSGYTTVGEVIRNLPENFNGGNNPQVQVGNAPGHDNASPTGGSAPNLRGLGAGSTLTLINGHRLPQDTSTGAVDISSIPLEAVERVEVVTDGASTAYGSDAVAGVVNFIMKKNFDGAKSTISVGKAAEGGGLERRFNQLLGTEWSSGSILLDYEHDKQDGVYSTQRDFTSTVLAPYSLLPDTTRDSVFVTADQSVSESIVAFADGLYTRRDSDHLSTFVAFPPQEPTYSQRASVGQYVVTVGGKANLPREWNATISATAEEQSSQLSTHNFGPSDSNQSQTSAETIHGRTRSIDAAADGQLIQFATGAVRLAVGAGVRHSSYGDSDAVSATTYTSGERTIDYAFAETAVPLVAPSGTVGLKRLDLNVSGRFEHYSDVGGKSVPKVGLLYVPVDEARVRATWGKSFRAPTLTDLHGNRQIFAFSLPDPISPTGTSVTLIPTGGSANLRPETSTSWTVGGDYTPQWLEGFSASVTYFHINYTDRIGTLPFVGAALTDPTNAPFVTRSPSAELQQDLIAAAGGNLINASGAPYNPATVAAVVSDQPLNVASQKIQGIDTLLNYKRPVTRGEMDFFANVSYLQLRQRLTVNSPEIELAGSAFKPPRFRARGGVTWENSSWQATAVANYLGDETNNNVTPGAHVASLTTVDLQLSFSPLSDGIWAGFRATLSVQNVLDKNPPFVQFNGLSNGFNYDSLNVTPLGRFVTLQFSKLWGPL